jgi:hypothetical protein
MDLESFFYYAEEGLAQLVNLTIGIYTPQRQNVITALQLAGRYREDKTGARLRACGFDAPLAKDFSARNPLQ